MDGDEMLEAYSRILAILGVLLALYAFIFGAGELAIPAIILIWAGIGVHGLPWLVDIYSYIKEEK